MKSNLIFNVDSYKHAHFLQYPKNTEYVNSYIEPRGKKESRFIQTMMFGLQAFIKEYLVGQVVTQEMIDEADELIGKHGVPFNKAGWEYILREHDGKLPVEIYAVPEGTVVDNGNVLVQIRNTDSKCYWLTSFLETSLLRAIWYPSTVATNSWMMKKLIKKYLVKTSDDASGLGFKLHDFGYRGVSSMETGELGGLAHLVNFQGTDTMGALVAARKYYGADCAGFSIPASEHSTITSWGKDNEVEAYENMLKQFAKPGSLVAVVSDSYDIWNACENIWGNELKQKVIDSGATVIVRPDSGDPVDTPVRVIEVLMQKYGYTINSKGYAVLNNVRVIQGDGIGYDEVKQILERLTKNGISTDNIAFGMGNNLLQELTRDTLNFSMKCSEITIAGQSRDVFKESPGKKSKKGRLALVRRDGKYKTIREDQLITGSHGKEKNNLTPVFRDGELLLDESLDQIRERSELYC